MVDYVNLIVSAEKKYQTAHSLLPVPSTPLAGINLYPAEALNEF